MKNIPDDYNDRTENNPELTSEFIERMKIYGEYSEETEEPVKPEEPKKPEEPRKAEKPEKPVKREKVKKLKTPYKASEKLEEKGKKEASVGGLSVCLCELFSNEHYTGDCSNEAVRDAEEKLFKKRLKAILGLILIILLICVIALIAHKVNNPKETPGEFKDDVYVNKYINLKIPTKEIEENYITLDSEADKDKWMRFQDGKNVENADTTCYFAALKDLDNGFSPQMFVIFLDKSSYSKNIRNNDDYLKYMIKDKMGIDEADIFDKEENPAPFNEKESGYAFRKVINKLSPAEETTDEQKTDEESVSYYQYFLVKKISSRARIVIYLSAYDEQTILDTLANLETIR